MTFKSSKANKDSKVLNGTHQKSFRSMPLESRIGIIFIAGLWITYLLSMFLCSSETQHVYIIVLLLCLLYLCSLVISIIKTGVCSIQSMFLCCLGCFCFGRFFLYIFGVFDFMNAPYAIYKLFRWKYQTAVIVVSAYIIFLTIFTLYLIFYKKRSLPASRKTLFPGRSLVLRLVYAAFAVSGPLLAALYFRQAMVVIQLGYTSYYNGAAAAALGGDALMSIMRLAFTIAFFMICTLENNEMRFYRASILYLLVIGVQLLQGSRSELMIAVLAILYIRHRVFGRDIHPIFLVLAVLVGVPAIYLLACFRSGTLSSFTYFDSFKYLFVSMSASVNVAAYYVQNRIFLPQGSFPFILDPIVRIVQYLRYPEIFAGGQSVAMIGIRHNLGHQLTYFMNHNYYLNGANIGGSFIAELLEFGLPGVVVGSALFTKLVSYFDEHFCSNLFFRFMALEFVGKIVFAPRAEFFYDTYSLFKYGGIFIFIWIFCKALYKIYYKNGRSMIKSHLGTTLRRQKTRVSEDIDIAAFQKGIDNRNGVIGHDLTKSRGAKLVGYYLAVAVASPRCRDHADSIQYISSLSVRSWNFDVGAQMLIYRGFCYRSKKELFQLYTFFAPFSFTERIGIICRAVASYRRRHREISSFSCWLEFCVMRSFLERMKPKNVITRGHYDEISTWMGELSERLKFDLSIYQHGVVLRSVTIPHRIYCSYLYGFDSYSLEIFKANYIRNPDCRYEVYPFGPSISFDRLEREDGSFYVAIAEQYNPEWANQVIELVHRLLPCAKIIVMLHPYSKISYASQPGVVEEGAKKYININLLLTESSTLALDYYRADKSLPIMYTAASATECFAGYPFIYAGNIGTLGCQIAKLVAEKGYHD